MKQVKPIRTELSQAERMLVFLQQYRLSLQLEMTRNELVAREVKIDTIAKTPSAKTYAPKNKANLAAANG
jgi:hypothetical protein